MKTYQLRYNEDTDRLEFDVDGLHCGECLEVLLPDPNGTASWQKVSFEFSDHWYMPGHHGIDPIGLFARK